MDGVSWQNVSFQVIVGCCCGQNDLSTAGGSIISMCISIGQVACRGYYCCHLDTRPTIKSEHTLFLCIVRSLTIGVCH